MTLSTVIVRKLVSTKEVFKFHETSVSMAKYEKGFEVLMQYFLT